MDLDAMIATATEEVAAAQTPPSAEVTEVTQEAEAPTETKQENEDVGKKPDSELTPEQLAKRERNRASHTRAVIREQKQKNRELMAEIERLKQASQAKPQQIDPSKPVKPILEQFTTFEEYENAKDDYYEALADWKAEQKLSARDKQTQETQANNTKDQYFAVRAQEIAQSEMELAKKAPEYATLLEQNADFFEEIKDSPTLKEALAEADNASLAIYALMKENSLDSLFDLPPTRLAAELAKAEIRGQQYLSKPKPTSNAPAPISAARGNTATKSLPNQSVDELMKHYGFK